MFLLSAVRVWGSSRPAKRLAKCHRSKVALTVGVDSPFNRGESPGRSASARPANDANRRRCRSGSWSAGSSPPASSKASGFCPSWSSCAGSGTGSCSPIRGRSLRRGAAVTPPRFGATAVASRHPARWAGKTGGALPGMNRSWALRSRQQVAETLEILVRGFQPRTVTVGAGCDDHVGGGNGHAPSASAAGKIVRGGPDVGIDGQIREHGRELAQPPLLGAARAPFQSSSCTTGHQQASPALSAASTRSRIAGSPSGRRK